MKIKLGKNKTYTLSLLEYIENGHPTSIQMLRRLESAQRMPFYLGTKNSQIEMALLKQRHSSHIKTLIDWYREELKTNKNGKFSNLI